MPKTEYLQGALDLLILKTLALGPNHGWGVQQRIKQVSREALRVSQGSLYPALHRLEAAGLVTSEMAASDNNRRARLYRLTGGRFGHRTGPLSHLLLTCTGRKTGEKQERPRSSD